MRESLSVDSQNIPCNTKEKGVVGNLCISLISTKPFRYIIIIVIIPVVFLSAIYVRLLPPNTNQVVFSSVRNWFIYASLVITLQ
jgi:hypothetical protein